MFVRNLFPTPFMNADGGQAGGGATNDDGQGQQDPQGGQQSQDPKAGQQGNDDSQNKQENMIPKSRFDEVNTKFKELQEQLDKINKEKEQAQLDAKKKNGEFEELYTTANQELEQTKTQFEQTSQRVGQLEGIIQTLVDAELEAVPEALRDLVPENFTAEQKLTWITQAKQKGLFGTVQNQKEEQELGGATNQQTQQRQVEVGKLSVTELFKNAYGSKK